MVLKAKSSQWQAMQSTGHTVFRRESAAVCQKRVKWFKVLPSSQESVEWPEELQTAMKAPSHQDGKEGSQESARRATSDQQGIERPVASKGRSAVRRASAELN